MTTELGTAVNEHLYGAILEYDEVEAFLNALTSRKPAKKSHAGDTPFRCV